MKQYCRYCVNLVAGNGTWCEKRQKEMSDSAAKRVNHCKDFAFCEIDAFCENLAGYHPREPYRKHQTQEARAGLDWLGDQLGMTIYDEEE